MYDSFSTPIAPYKLIACAFPHSRIKLKKRRGKLTVSSSGEAELQVLGHVFLSSIIYVETVNFDQAFGTGIFFFQYVITLERNRYRV